jgi:hypothetical protein
MRLVPAEIVAMCSVNFLKGFIYSKAQARKFLISPPPTHPPTHGHRGMARLPRKQNRAPALRGPHRIRTHASPPPGLGREVESRENQSTAVHPWDAGSGRLSRGSRALGRGPPAPAAWAAGERRGCPYLRERFAHGEGNGHA